MTVKKSAPFTYLNFPEELYYLKKETDIEDLAKFFKYMNRFQKELRFFSDYLFFIIDYSKRKYITMAGAVENISGFHPMDFLQGGLEFVVDIFQKDDFSVFNNKITPSSIEFLQQQQHAHQESLNFVFEFNYRMRNKNGSIFTALQKASYITDPQTRLPLYAFGVCKDITLYKKNDCMVRVINKISTRQKLTLTEPVSIDYYYPTPDEASPSAREKEVLLHLAEGLSSKQIADKMHLSQNTVMNHRKNILRKTNTKNVAELISYAIKNRII